MPVRAAIAVATVDSGTGAGVAGAAEAELVTTGRESVLSERSTIFSWQAPFALPHEGRLRPRESTRAERFDFILPDRYNRQP